MSEQSDLIARLEAATEGSRALDCDVALAIGWTMVDRYTRSIDAALTLVPEGWWFHISHIEASVCPTSPAEDAGRALNGDWALTNALQYDARGKPVYQKSLILHDRKRTALAICIAALRARMKE